MTVEHLLNEAQERTPQNYLKLCDEACTVAGPADYYWNERYKSALYIRNIIIVESLDPQQPTNCYPNNQPMMAPQPFNEIHDAWKPGSYMVWNSNRYIIIDCNPKPPIIVQKDTQPYDTSPKNT